MIELIAILAGIAVLILTPIEINKIKNGWVRTAFKPNPNVPLSRQEQFLTAYRTQLMILVVAGLIFGVFNIFMGVISERPYDDYVKYFAGALWFVVSATSYWGREQIANVAPAKLPPPAANS